MQITGDRPRRGSHHMYHRTRSSTNQSNSITAQLAGTNAAEERQVAGGVAERQSAKSKALASDKEARDHAASSRMSPRRWTYAKAQTLPAQ